MKAYAITIEGYHENPFRVRACLVETDAEAKVVAEKFFYETWNLTPGSPLPDTDWTAEVWNEAGEHVGRFTAYYQKDKVPVWA